MLSKPGKDIVGSAAGMLITLPGIDAKAPGLGTRLNDRLAECGVRRSAIDAQFNVDARLHRADQEHPERQVSRPCGFLKPDRQI